MNKTISTTKFILSFSPAMCGLSYYLLSVDKVYEECPIRDLQANDIVIGFRKVNFVNGSVCAIRNPHDPEDMIFRRIVHQEGEIVRIKNYWFRIPRCYYWVESDDQNCTIINNMKVNANLIYSKSLLVVWPLHRFRLITHDLEEFSH